MAHIQRDPNDDQTWCVITDDGRMPVREESYEICSAVACALNHPEWWEPTEAYEIADGIRESTR